MSGQGAHPGRRRIAGGGSLLAWTEWIAAALGAAFLIAVIGYLGWRSAARERTPAAISVSALSVTRAGERYVVRFEAHNQGDATAAGAVIEGRLSRGTETIEEAEVTLPYAPGRSKREGALIFENDPGAFRLVLSATGYHDP